jgi:tRNA modification GTPase
MAQDTIFALSSGRPPAAIAIVRVSGPGTGEALRRLAGSLPQPRQATFAVLKRADGAPIDDAVVLWFPGPHSATGEDIAEFQVHGGRAVLAALLDELARIEGLRPAEAGEFTRRAFENGKLGLTEAEGLDDLIHADTDIQRRHALRQMKGLLGRRAENWRQRIIAASALVEVGIDFSDEGDVPDDLLAPAMRDVASLADEIRQVLSASAHGERLRDGLVVAIAGAPNVGKSTLLNRIARREAAIVSPYAGTTRDVIEVHLDLGGYPVVLLDTAGIREAADPVEQEGVRRARARAEEADLVLWVSDATDGGADRPPDFSASVWQVWNKVDVAPARGDGEDATTFPISAETGQGVDDLIGAIGQFAADYFGAVETGLVTRLRQRKLLEEAVAALDRASGSTGGEELVAEELRIAATALGRLLGRVDVEDILDAIFRDFCIGK